MGDTKSMLIGAAISLVVFCVGRQWARRHSASKSAPLPDTVGLKKPLRFGKWTMALAGVVPYTIKQRKQIAQELLAVGQYHAEAFEEFLAIRNLMFFGAIFSGSVVFAAGLADQHELPVGVACGVLCILAYSVPRVMLSARASRCTRQIEQGIPDALDMIAMTVAGGIPLETAVARVAEQLSRTHRRLGQELQIVARQARTGSVEQAFAGLGARLTLPEVAAWCALMSQSRRLGGKIVDSLRDYANRIRHDRKNRAERSGNTASIKLLLPVVMCLSPPIAIMLIGPALLDFRDFINRKQTPTEVVEQLRESTPTP